MQQQVTVEEYHQRVRGIRDRIISNVVLMDLIKSLIVEHPSIKLGETIPSGSRILGRNNYRHVYDLGDVTYGDEDFGLVLKLFHDPVLLNVGSADALDISGDAYQSILLRKIMYHDYHLTSEGIAIPLPHSDFLPYTNLEGAVFREAIATEFAATCSDEWVKYCCGRPDYFFAPSFYVVVNDCGRLACITERIDDVAASSETIAVTNGKKQYYIDLKHDNLTDEPFTPEFAYIQPDMMVNVETIKGLYFVALRELLLKKDTKEHLKSAFCKALHV